MAWLEGGLAILALVVLLGGAALIGFVWFITKDGNNIFR